VSKNSISNAFEANCVYLPNNDRMISKLAWNPHSKFQGVYLKHLIQASDSNGTISSHLVKIDPNCMIDDHIHEGKIEIHEVMEGKGNCIVNGRTIAYNAGSVAILPADMLHKVIAGKEGLLLLAQFSPALL